jgi:hypothetical protein
LLKTTCELINQISTNFYRITVSARRPLKLIGPDGKAALVGH